MKETTSRRSFLKTAAATGIGLSLPGTVRAFASRPSSEVTVGMIGTGGRGIGLTRGFAQLPGARIAYVSDVDERRRQEAHEAVRAIQGNEPQAVTDFRRMLEDPSLDAVVIAMPEHWHTPAAILAMQAGKHVYVEKPGSHNAREGEMIVEAARRHGRVVQMGNQRRSWPKMIEVIQRIRGGVIGPVHHARGWYANTRAPIGRGNEVAVPPWLDFELWQGPAPRQPYRDNILHYNWHWFWNWGTGEAGNNGVHSLDLCRWALGVGRPVRVSSAGGRFFYEDDWETPDTQTIAFDFAEGKSIVWEGLSCNGYGMDGTGFGASIHGKDGTVVIEGLGYSLYDKKGERIEQVSGEGGGEIDVTGPGFDIDAAHLGNFIDGIRNGTELFSPIEEGQKSTLMCHLGNIAHRTGRTLHCRPENGHIVGDPEAMNLWGRIYAPGWAL